VAGNLRRRQAASRSKRYVAPTNDFYVFGFNASGTLFSSKGIADTYGTVVLGAGEISTQIQADEILFTAALHALGLSSNSC
jgi:hypothetical protein